jgi:hypothetical protein
MTTATGAWLDGDNRSLAQRRQQELGSAAAHSIQLVGDGRMSSPR